MAIQRGPCGNRPGRDQLYQIPMNLFPVISPKLRQKLGLDDSKQLGVKAILDSPLSTIPLLCEERQHDLWNEWTAAAIPVMQDKLINPRRVVIDANVRVQAAIDGQGFILADSLMSNEIDNRLLIQSFNECLEGYGYSLKSSSTRIFSSDANKLKSWFSK